MIKIAFCDDDMEVLHQMNELLDRYRVERNEDITYAAFQSPFELLTEIEKGIRPDILFLDVVMPGQNGMDVAKEIRQYDTNMKIIFLTSSPEFAVESYSVGAYFYQSPFHDLRTCPGCDRCRRTRPGHGHKAVPQSRSIHIHRRGTEIRLYLTGKCKSPARVQIQTAICHIVAARAYDLPCVTRHGDRMIRI